MKVLLLAISLCWFVPQAWAERMLTTISLHQAEAEQIARVLRSTLAPGSSISTYQNTLVIRATAAELRQIHALVAELDSKGRQLWISVRVGEQEGGGSYFGQPHHQPITRVNRGIHTEIETRVTVQERHFTGSAETGQGVRATEGLPAYIATGQSLTTPVTSRWREPVVAQQGFYVTARLDGSTVLLTIRQENASLQGGGVDKQQLRSHVSGGLGQWIAVGAISEQASGVAIDADGRQLTNTKTVSSVYIRVLLQ
ncbi:type II/III secretion system protein [Sinobacterium caligoides]|uniref:Type II/III secretion system protein n=1 Tax=Sinobacterium caligoides TaxID=933926 RepID=A0A3N2DNB7_9GAMM|nr:secretin N-terminal domain-containing protein [Sinobacterium caligoides]ROS01260.1 type II/III secretion system protein [Sinobacterium caligoides]